MSHGSITRLVGAALTAALAGAGTTPPAAHASAAPPAIGATAFRAGGNEPSWRLDIAGGETTLLTNFGQDRLVVPTPNAQVSGATTRYVARTKGGELAVTVVDRLCVDSMSGMPHPKTVQVVVDGRTLNGCGGEPVSLLQGAEWSVVRIAGAPLATGSKATLAFGPGGKLSGQSSCNRFTGAYSLSGEGLSISPAAGTRMACAEPVMAQERAFLATLGQVQSFSIAADGSLQLRTGDGRAIEARRR